MVKKKSACAKRSFEQLRLISGRKIIFSGNTPKNNKLLNKKVNWFPSVDISIDFFCDWPQGVIFPIFLCSLDCSDHKNKKKRIVFSPLRHVQVHRTTWQIFISQIMAAKPHFLSSVGEVYSIHWQHIYRCVRPPTPTSTNECPRYDTKQSNGDATVLELMELWRTPFIAISTLTRVGSTW